MDIHGLPVLLVNSSKDKTHTNSGINVEIFI